MRWLLKPKECQINKADELDVRNRIISILHGLTLTVCSAYHFYNLHASCGDQNTDFEKMVLYIAVGYFQYDFWAMAYYGLLDSTMVIHHSICILGMSVPLTHGFSANHVVRGMLVAEVSNPFMHVRCILKHYGLRYTLSYETMEIMFMMLYIFSRIILGCHLVSITCLCKTNHQIAKACSVLLLL